MKIKAIITGATGMVGEGVLHECLLSEEVEKVLVVGRKPCGVSHPKLMEVLITDFMKVETIAPSLSGYNACYFCMGVSSMGMDKEKYKQLTYDLTMEFAHVVKKQNADMTFCYVSGTGTDGTEKGRIAWARVKGKTENDLAIMGFRQAYAFRPGYIQPTKGLKNTYKMYKVLAPLYPLWKVLMPNGTVTLKELGQAMINTVNKGFEKPVLDCRDIRTLAAR
jgi:hypothetical protein